MLSEPIKNDFGNRLQTVEVILSLFHNKSVPTQTPVAIAVSFSFFFCANKKKIKSVAFVIAFIFVFDEEHTSKGYGILFHFIS